MTAPADDFLRIEKGHAKPEELAALTAVLMARVAAGDGRAARLRPAGRAVTAAWRRPERRPAFCAPHSWQG